MGKLIDLTGQRFGSLVVLEKAESRKVKHGTVARWKCKCDCGKIKVVDGTGLREGRIKTCGTHKKEYIGQRYGRLVVLEELKTTRKNGVNTRWFKCKCDCGNIVNVRQSNLVTETRSCGCYKRDIARERQTIHGMNGTRVWNIYYQMKQRVAKLSYNDNEINSSNFDIFMNYLENKDLVDVSLHDRISLCLKHLKLLKSLKNDKLAALEIRNHIGWYFKGVKGANELKNKVYQTSNIHDIISLLNEFKEGCL